jgi:CDP-diacylglycerol--glycerol-3-phosphate 3-phosphatidyltransferase
MAAAWRTKPTDRFILKWIKLYLSAPISSRLAGMTGIEPWMITLFSTGLGVTAGVCLAFGLTLTAALLALLSQVFDGVDGQLARIRGRGSKGGALLDSVLDRYSDGFMILGTALYVIAGGWLWRPLALIVAALALIGSNGISYSTARAESLRLDLGPPTLASKGTRMSVMILAAAGANWWAPLPVVALVYLAVHTNAVLARRLLRVGT